MRTSRALLTLAALLATAVLAPVLAAQAAGTAVDPTILAPGATNEWGLSVLWAYFSSAGLESLKQRGLIGMSSETTWLIKRGVSILLALAAALGVHASFDAAAGTLTVTGLLLPGIWTAGTETVRQWVFQQIAYKVAVEAKA